MNDQELLRYSRHILLPEIDIEGLTMQRYHRAIKTQTKTAKTAHAVTT